jgi:hypothetical protein
MAGKNSGNSGAAIGQSASIGLSYLASGNDELIISNLSKPVDLWIKRDPNMQMPEYSLINITKFTNKSKLVTYKFNLGGQNVSTHIQLKPFIKRNVTNELIFQINNTNSSNLTTQAYTTTLKAITTKQLMTSFSLNNSNLTNSTNFTDIYEYQVLDVAGYVFVLKFGEIAQLSTLNASYDYWQVFCPEGN